MEPSVKPDALSRVVIVGGGFGGLAAAQALGRAPIRLTVIDRTNHHLFQPLLYQVATAGLSPADIAAPIRNVLSRFPNTEVLMSEVTGVDLEGRCVQTGDGPVPYDYLILATGSTESYFGHEDWQRFAPGLKSISDALNIRRDILLAFESAEKEQDEEARQALMTFVLVGAGPTGVEMAGAIAELAHVALPHEFRRIDTRQSRIILVEAGPRILSTFPERLAKAAAGALADLRVDVRTNTKVEEVSAEGIRVGDQWIRAATVVWTAGVKASPAGSWLGAEVDRGGRVKVGADLSAPGQPNVFVIGDTASVIQDGHPLPGVAPVAMQQGRYVADAIRRRVAGQAAPPPFRYKDKGSLATVGRSFAIADVGSVQISGFPAWLLWLGVHIVYLIGFRSRFLVMFQWAWAYFTAQRGVRLIAPGPERG